MQMQNFFSVYLPPFEGFSLQRSSLQRLSSTVVGIRFQTNPKHLPIIPFQFFLVSKSVEPSSDEDKLFGILPAINVSPYKGKHTIAFEQKLLYKF
uniref:Uncharacterized protein n=1 Tax=Octopus bimaculoides TaxID=37653 RepID=A0A0L8I4W9_OCTBM